MSEVLAWLLGLVMGAGLVVVAWAVVTREAARLEQLRAANERALRARADRSWYIAGPARLIEASPPPRPLGQRPR